MKEDNITLFRNNFCDNIPCGKVKLVFYNWEPKYNIFIDKDALCLDKHNFFNSSDAIELKGLCLIQPLGYNLSSFNEIIEILCTKESINIPNKKSINWYYTNL